MLIIQLVNHNQNNTYSGFAFLDSEQSNTNMACWLNVDNLYFLITVCVWVGP